MINTNTKIHFCKYDRYIKIRLSPREMNPIKYASKTFNFDKIRRENSNMKLNTKYGSCEPCKCSQCNPDTCGDYGK